MAIKMRHLLSVCIALFALQPNYSQLNLSHEIGVIVGPVQFRSDFGQRFNEENNIGNMGYGIGIIHYLNFSYNSECNCYSRKTFFNDHFKLRTELSLNKTKLDHHGDWVAASATDSEADRLRAHSGEANNVDLGMQLEYFPLSIRGFSNGDRKLAPFITLGAHYTASTPKQFTNYTRPGNIPDNNVYNADNIYTPWITAGAGEYPISENKVRSFSVVSSIGTRYKLSRLSDLMIDLRFQYYFSDWIDGLNHKLPSNQFNDALVWLNFGYIYYLD